MTFLDDCADQQFDTMSEETHLTPGHLDVFQLVDIDIADRIVPLPSVPQRRFEPDRASIGKDLPLAKFWTREGDETGPILHGDQYRRMVQCPVDQRVHRACLGVSSAYS